jgi:hypothetical protein
MGYAPQRQGAGRPGEDYRSRLSAAIADQDGHDATSTDRGPEDKSGWRGPGRVVIKEGLPQFAGMGAADGSTASDAGSDAGASGGRFPSIDDFPPVAQQAYRARAGEQRDGNSAPRPSAVYGQPEGDSRPSKPGLLRRIAEAARGKRDEPLSTRRSAAPESSEEVDLPVFFGRDKR